MRCSPSYCLIFSTIYLTRICYVFFYIRSGEADIRKKVLSKHWGEQRHSCESNSDDCDPHMSYSRVVLFFFFYLTAATRTPRTRIDRLPRSGDRRTDLATVDLQRPRFLVADPCRFPRRTRTSDILSSDSVSRTVMLTIF